MSKQEITLDEDVEPVRIQPYEHQTRYYETDQTGMIHQTNFLKWMEDARMDIMEQMGMGAKQMSDLQIMCPLISVNIDFTGAVRFDETVVVEAKVVRYDGRQMDLEYVMYDKESGELRARGKSRHVFTNRSGAPISMKRVYPELDTKFFEFK